MPPPARKKGPINPQIPIDVVKRPHNKRPPQNHQVRLPLFPIRRPWAALAHPPPLPQTLLRTPHGGVGGGHPWFFYNQGPQASHVHSQSNTLPKKSDLTKQEDLIFKK